jgi:hypothetical protein
LWPASRFDRSAEPIASLTLEDDQCATSPGAHPDPIVREEQAMTGTGFAAAMVAIGFFAASAGAEAQPQPQDAPASQSSPGGPMMGRGPGPGPGTGMGMGRGAQNTYGWSMMTPAERQAHMARMRSFTSRAECHAYVADHHRLMVERARQRGMYMPASPRRDPCAGLD